MEKYTQFRDKSTGISPFLPITQKNSIGISESNLIKIELLPKLLLIILRIILSIPFIIIYFITSSSILLKIIFQILGISIDLSIQNLKSKLINKDLYPSKNQIYFINFSTPLDPLILKIISNDKFIILFPNQNGELVELNLFETIKLGLNGYESIIKTSNKSLKLDQFKDQIIYIFAEGTTSNGKSILPFQLKQSKFDDFLSLSSNSNSNSPIFIRSIGIKIIPSTLVTPLKYNIWFYLFKTLSNYSIQIKLKINIINELNPLESSLIKIRQSFINNGKFKLVNEEFNHKTKQKFIQVFNGRK